MFFKLPKFLNLLRGARDAGVASSLIVVIVGKLSSSLSVLGWVEIVHVHLLVIIGNNWLVPKNKTVLLKFRQSP